MAGAADTARFFLEQSLPELRELEEKGLFTKDEVSAIAKKRSDFEHNVHSSGVKSADFARYAEFEMNLEFLRRRRAKRVHSKMQSHAWQRRMMSLMARATRKFPNDMSLWMQYAELARKQKAFKKLSKILTSMVRLHATVPEAWIYATTYAMGDLGDIVKARSYMQRGLRFCKESHSIWLEYAKLELSYLAKLHTRHEILGLDRSSSAIAETATIDNPDADMVTLPTVTFGEMTQTLSEPPNASAVDLSKTPALSGAIPMAIFDGAMEHFHDTQLGSRFFDLVAEFEGLPCSMRIAQHIVNNFMSTASKDAVTLDIHTRLPLIGIVPTSSSFPQALTESLQRLDQSLSVQPPTDLIYRSLKWLAVFLKKKLDADIREVIATTFARLLRRYRKSLGNDDLESGDKFASLLEKLYTGAGEGQITEVIEESLELWPTNDRLQRLKNDADKD